ncbi:hypothetical protein GGF37_004775 [Kickxella alabastrina]|nr:hypothetical protein GGF37_004775 [Kickxella alabastrina]
MNTQFMSPTAETATQQVHDRTSCNDILCLAPNASYQVTMLFDKIIAGNVNRASKQSQSIGGKGQNFSIATKQFYGHTNRVTLLQILGGHTGTQIENMLLEQGIDCITVHTPLPTRTCTTCLDVSTNQMTELIGISNRVEEEVVAEYVDIATRLLHSGAPPRALTLCGTIPPGFNSERIAEIISSKTDKTLVFVDAAIDILPLLDTGKVDILKVNLSELKIIASAVGLQFNATQGIPPAILELGKKIRVSIVAVTDGPFMAYLADIGQGTCHMFVIPDLLADKELFVGNLAEVKLEDEEKRVLNPIGAGDTCSSVTLNCLLDGAPAIDAFALGLAAASASCLVPMINCIIDRVVMNKIRAMTTITQV